VGLPYPSTWTWSNVVRCIALRSGVERFTTHTPRHLRLTDLARDGWSAAEIARFAGQSRPRLAVRYVRLADVLSGPTGRDLKRRRAEQLAGALLPEAR
jgi:hypothetical protein